MDREHVRAFATRDRRGVASLKRRFWAQRFCEEGSVATVAAGEASRTYALRIRPDLAEDRSGDLAEHVAMKVLLDRAAHAFRRR